MVTSAHPFDTARHVIVCHDLIRSTCALAAYPAITASDRGHSASASDDERSHNVKKIRGVCVFDLRDAKQLQDQYARSVRLMAAHYIRPFINRRVFVSRVL